MSSTTPDQRCGAWSLVSTALLFLEILSRDAYLRRCGVEPADIVGEVFLRTHRRWRARASAGRPQVWPGDAEFFFLVQWAARDAIRAFAITSARSAPMAAIAEVAHQQTPLQELEAGRLQRSLNTVSRTLSPQERHIVVRSIQDEASTHLIAAELGISASTAQRRLRQVVRQLRSCVAK